MMVTAHGGDAWNPAEYRVRCRWLPWEPRTTSVAGRIVGVYGNDGGGIGGLGDDALAALIVGVLLVPLVVAAVMVLGELALLLLALPLLTLWRVVFRRPWLVYVARNGAVLHRERVPTLTAARRRRDEIAAGLAAGTWKPAGAPAETPRGRHHAV